MRPFAGLFITYFFCALLAACPGAAHDADDANDAEAFADVAAANEPAPSAPSEPRPQALPPLREIIYDEPFTRAGAHWICVADANGTSSPVYELRGADDSRYLLSAELSRGSFGAVHYAVDTDGNEWAVKHMFVPSDDTKFSRTHWLYASSEDDVRRELGLLARVHEDFEIRAVLQADSEVFVVMQLMDGDAGGALGEIDDKVPVLRAMVQQIGQDAERLHALGFVHNDLRLHNFLYRRDGRVMLADFGFAMRVGEAGYLERAAHGLFAARGLGTRVNEVYVAPEAWLGRFDYKADTWSLGLTLVQALLPEPWMFEGILELGRDHAGFAAWQHGLRDADGSLRLERIVNPDETPVPLRHWYFHAMFNAVKNADPQLGALILDKMLVDDPLERAGMGELAEQARQLFATDAEERHVELLADVAAKNAESRDAALAQLHDALRAESQATTCPNDQEPFDPMAEWLGAVHAAR